MNCGKTYNGSHWYSWLDGNIRVTLFPEYPNRLEMSVKIFRFYHVFNFGVKP